MSRFRVAGYGIVVALAALTYLHDLESPHIPKNGDEYPYTHITRVTAASGHLLPLQSDLDGMRNTKPPLLFWQGIVSTKWGRSFGLGPLRYPSVVYTFLTAGLLFLLGRRLCGDRGVETGLVAALGYLAFFSTYRYGRPFLTNAPETFWLLLPFFILLYWRSTSVSSRLVVPGLMGLALGIGLLYKSFALAAPVGLGLGLWYLRERGFRIGETLAKDLPKVVLVVSVALAVFALWFVLDPDPRAVWDEFVVGENVGKFEQGGAYLPGFLWGRFSVPSLAVGFVLNAGLLVVPVVALVVSTWRRRRELDSGETLLWLWILGFFVVYCLPAQRSSRYLLPVMPPLALLLSLHWSRLSRVVLRSTLGLSGLVLAAVAALTLGLRGSMAEGHGPGHGVLLVVSGVVLVAVWRRLEADPPGVLAVVFLTLLCFSSLLGPLAGPAGRYDASAQRAAEGRAVWVPVDFTAKEEGYRLLLPGAQVHPYPDGRDDTVKDVLARHPLAVVRLRPGDPTGKGARVLGERLDLRGRHSGAEIRAMLGGRLFENLFVREVLVERAGDDGA